jgi:NOL1/NOP2/fmu family ribosome biogenesis protein
LLLLDLTQSDNRVEKYLRGETLDCEGVQNGWCLVCVEGFPIGWGKAVNGVLKNHLPKGLRK